MIILITLLIVSLIAVINILINYFSKPLLKLNTVTRLYKLDKTELLELQTKLNKIKECK